VLYLVLHKRDVEGSEFSQLVLTHAPGAEAPACAIGTDPLFIAPDLRNALIITRFDAESAELARAGVLDLRLEVLALLLVLHASADQ